MKNFSLIFITILTDALYSWGFISLVKYISPSNDYVFHFSAYFLAVGIVCGTFFAFNELYERRKFHLDHISFVAQHLSWIISSPFYLLGLVIGNIGYVISCIFLHFSIYYEPNHVGLK